MRFKRLLYLNDYRINIFFKCNQIYLPFGNRPSIQPFKLHTCINSITNETMKKLKSLIMENRKQIIWLTVTVIAAWFAIELISNWSAFMDGYRSGMEQ